MSTKRKSLAVALATVLLVAATVAVTLLCVRLCAEQAPTDVTLYDGLQVDMETLMDQPAETPEEAEMRLCGIALRAYKHYMTCIHQLEDSGVDGLEEMDQALRTEVNMAAYVYNEFLRLHPDVLDTYGETTLPPALAYVAYNGTQRAGTGEGAAT